MGQIIVYSKCPDKDCLKCFECLFQPTLKTLSICGMYICFSDQKKILPEEVPKNRLRSNYGRFLALFLWAFFGRTFLLFFTYIPGFYTYLDFNWLTHRGMDEEVGISSFVIVACYFFRCATICGMFNTPSKPTKTRRSLAVLWEEIDSTSPEHKQSEYDLHHMERALAYGVFPFLVFASMAFTLPIVIDSHFRITDRFGTFLALVSTSFILIAHFISYCIWLSSVLCLLAISASLTKRYLEVTRDIIKMQQSPDPGVSGDLDGVQLKHHKVCNGVQATDRMFQSYLFITYVMFIPETCFGLFHLIFNTNGPIYQLYLGWWVILGMASFLSLSLTAASVSSTAHGCQGPIRGLSVKNLTLDQHVKISMFLERLSGPTIGLSCLDLFVVTKGVVLSVASAVVTYFIIFVQFNTGENK